MSASRSSLGAVTLVLALAGIVAAAESSPSSPAAYVSLDSASVFADSSREMSPDSLLPISASMATENVGNGSAVDVPNVDLGQGFDCDPTCNCHAEPLWVFRGSAIILQRSTPTTSTLAFVPGGPSLINANDFHFGFRTGFEVGAIRRLNDCWDIDMRYLQIDSLNASVGPVDTESSAVVFQQRGSVVFSQPPHSVTADYGSILRSAEIGVGRQTRDWLTFLGGFRYVHLEESLALTQGVAFHHQVDTRNDLYGGQVGIEASLVNRSRVRLDG